MVDEKQRRPVAAIPARGSWNPEGRMLAGLRRCEDLADALNSKRPTISEHPTPRRGYPGKYTSV